MYNAPAPGRWYIAPDGDSVEPTAPTCLPAIGISSEIVERSTSGFRDTILVWQVLKQSSDAGYESTMKSEPQWYAIYCRSKQERVVHDRLIGQGFHPYLAEYQARVRWGSRWRRVRKNLLPGYLLIRVQITPRCYIAILQTQGVVKFVGNPWPNLSVVSAREVESLQLLLGSKQQFKEIPYWRKGQWVEVVGGPLAGVNGRLMTTPTGKHRVVVSIELLKRSVSLEVDSGYLRPISLPRRE